MLAMFKQSKPLQDVQTGGIYRRVRARENLVETAKVLSIENDSLGIPHVHFEVSISSPSRTCVHGARVLALQTFARQYPEAIES